MFEFLQGEGFESNGDARPHDNEEEREDDRSDDCDSLGYPVVAVHLFERGSAAQFIGVRNFHVSCVFFRPRTQWVVNVSRLFPNLSGILWNVQQLSFPFFQCKSGGTPRSQIYQQCQGQYLR